MIFALIGNQNCGKTTLFNQLTQSNQHVGNFPGVTVEQKLGVIKGTDIKIVDLPGIYSLSPYTNDEIVTLDFLINEKPNAIINIVDATNIERNLYLTLQLIELQIPMVLALNMMDEVKANKGCIDINGLQNELGIPIIPISASKNQGVSELLDKAVWTAQSQKRPYKVDFCSGAVHRAVHAIAHIIEDNAEILGIPKRFAAIKLADGDGVMLAKLNLTQNEIDMIDHAIKEMEMELGTDREAALADMRYSFIEKHCQKHIIKIGESREYLRSVKIDALLTHKFFALPIFLGIILTIFWLTFGVIGSSLSELLGLGIEQLTGLADRLLTSAGINAVVHSLVFDGIFTGIGSVLSFLPIIITLFLFLSILEDSGYMARVAFIMDKPMRKIGLSGRSFVPMIMGFGCSVPAVMATRTLASRRDRKMTILLIPFMSCSAKLPVYALFTAVFFEKYQALVMLLLYVIGILSGILSAFIMKASVLKGDPVPFIMELPNYRFPTIKSVLLLMWEKSKDFIQKAFTLIFAASIIIWFLQSFDITLNPVDGGEGSLLSVIGKGIAPFFKPLGFSDWRISTSLITGFAAKEAVVSTLAVLMGTDISGLSGELSSVMSTLSALSFLIFTLIYTPCIAAIATVKKEFKSIVPFMIVYQIGFAWILSFIVYNVGRLFLK